VTFNRSSLTAKSFGNKPDDPASRVNAEFPATETAYEQTNISSEKRQILRVDAQIEYLKVIGNVA